MRPPVEAINGRGESRTIHTRRIGPMVELLVRNETGRTIARLTMTRDGGEELATQVARPVIAQEEDRA